MFFFFNYFMLPNLLLCLPVSIFALQYQKKNVQHLQKKSCHCLVSTRDAPLSQFVKYSSKILTKINFLCPPPLQLLSDLVFQWHLHLSQHGVRVLTCVCVHKIHTKKLSLIAQVHLLTPEQASNSQTQTTQTKKKKYASTGNTHATSFCLRAVNLDPAQSAPFLWQLCGWRWLAWFTIWALLFQDKGFSAQSKGQAVKQ